MSFPGIARRARIGVLALAALLAGCSGGHVAIRSAGTAAPPAQAGVHANVSGGAGLVWGALLGLLLADFWLTSPAATPSEEDPAEKRRSLWQPIDRGWVDRGP